MKILFLTGWYPHKKNPNHGVFVRDQAVALGKKFEVLVVSARIDYSSFAVSSFHQEENSYEGVREISITVKKSLPVFNQLNFFLVVIRATLRITKSFKPDVIHGNIGYPGAFWAWSVSKSLRVPCIITEHTKITNNFRSPVHRFLTLFGLKRASGVVAVSSWHAAEISKMTGKDVNVIGNIIQIKRFNDVNLKPPGQPVHFGILGGMDTPVKGIDVLLNACAQIDADYLLHIGGKGKLLQEYEALAADLKIKHKCVFHGLVEHTQVPGFMSQLHFFVSASRSETFGMVMAEAMASGLPVVATDSGGSAEMITSENGILVKNADALRLADAIQAMIRKYHTYNADKIKASVERFSEEAFIEKISTAYEEVLAKTAL